MKLAERCAALPAPMRRLVALILLPLSLAVGGVILAYPLRSAWLAQQQWRTETKQLLSEAASVPVVQEALEQRIEAVRNSQLRTKFYPGEGAMSAGVLLQGDVDLVMSSVQANSRTLSPIPVTEDASLLRHGVRVSASLRINQLQDLLNALARQPRLLRVEQLTVVAPQAQMPEENPPLAVTMEIYGYALAPTPTVAEPTVAVTAEVMP